MDLYLYIKGYVTRTFRTVPDVLPQSPRVLPLSPSPHSYSPGQLFSHAKPRGVIKTNDGNRVQTKRISAGGVEYKYSSSDGEAIAEKEQDRAKEETWRNFSSTFAENEIDRDYDTKRELSEIDRKDKFMCRVERPSPQLWKITSIENSFPKSPHTPRQSVFKDSPIDANNKNANLAGLGNAGIPDTTNNNSAYMENHKPIHKDVQENRGYLTSDHSYTDILMFKRSKLSKSGYKNLRASRNLYKSPKYAMTSAFRKGRTKKHRPNMLCATPTNSVRTTSVEYNEIDRHNGTEKDLLELESDMLKMDMAPSEFLKKAKAIVASLDEKNRPVDYNAETWQKIVSKRAENAKRDMEFLRQNSVIITDILAKKEAEKRKSIKPFPVLPPEAVEKINKIWYDGEYDEMKIHVKLLQLQVTQGDLERLARLEWLNDAVINIYMALINHRAKQPGAIVPPVHCFSTHFLTKLTNTGYVSIKRWTRKVDLFEKEFVVVPVHLGNHWCVAVINFRDKLFEYYDSMGGSNPGVLRQLRNYIQDESMDKKKVAYSFEKWQDYTPTKHTPQQGNCSDCGVFMCQFSEYRARGKDFNFSQADMPYFRQRMVYEILELKLMEQ
eukprot:CFRG6163T1